MSTDLYRRLQQHLDRMPVPFPTTSSGVEIRILQRLFTEEQAEAALALSMVPEGATTILKRLPSSWSLERLISVLDVMTANGLVERAKIRKQVRYSKAVLAVGIYERQLTRLTPELQRDVEQYFDEGFGRAFHSVTPPQLRVVPVNIDLRTTRAVTTYDDVRGFVTAAEGPFAVMDCICRRGRDLLGQPCRQTSLRTTCMTFGAVARGMVDSGAAHYIDREAVLGILTAADREGLVLEPQNTVEPWFICCCCGCCCGVLRSAKQLPEPAAHLSSNYVAASDAEICSGCAVCETRCQMDAVRMTNGSAAIDTSRCIGCGLCVTTCTTGAMQLSVKQSRSQPSPSTPALYLSMYRDRFGLYETAKALGKALLQRQV